MTAEFSKEIKDYYQREELVGLTQASIAHDTGIDVTVLSKVFAGKRNLKPAPAESLMRALKVPPDGQARFLLLAAGYSSSLVHSSLEGLSGIDQLKPKRDLINKLQQILEDEMNS